MPEKRAILLDSVKRLLALNISDSEIIENLKGVGLEEDEARSIIEEAGGKRPSAPAAGEEQAVEEISPEGEGEGSGEEPAAEEISDQIVASMEAPRRQKAKASPREKEGPDEEGEPEIGVQAPQKPGVDMAELWKRGILTTVNSKLGQMEKLKKDIDSVINAKVKEQTGKEITTMKIVFDSQKTLLLDKIHTELEKTRDEALELIRGEMEKVRAAQAEEEQLLKRLEAKGKFNAELINTINDRTSKLDAARAGAESDVKEFIADAETRTEAALAELREGIEEADERVTKSLDLQSKIAEGLLQDAQDKVDSMALAKSGELEAEIKGRIAELDALRKKIDPKVVGDELNRIKAASGELRKLQKSQLAAMAEENRKAMNETMDNLELFKQQFITTIQKNVSELNKSKKELGEQLKKRDAMVDEHVKLIDMKMKELTEFEKTFAAEMGIVLENVVPGKKKSQKQKKK